MKKIAIVILVGCYLAVTSGVIVNFHYCMDQLASTHLFGGESKQCAKCGMYFDDSNGCCRDEVQVVKMETDQKPGSSIIVDFHSLDAPVQVPSAFLSASFFNVQPEAEPSPHPPPLLPKQDTYLQNCVFRI